ncbi:hypothetical protein BGZ60DRAFT_501302 [Tricladium varicosporioides]|nr:hypothetical protein BGZ60DRAFT_501302 [Hymenoscyphus varicosporioides]
MDAFEYDHDFNNNWGSILGTTELDQRLLSSSLAREYIEDPSNVLRKSQAVLAQYVDKFENFFNGILPISFHGHVTDATCPTTIASMVLGLAIFSKSDKPDAAIQPSTPESRKDAIEILDWSDVQLQTPRWLVVESSYAACYGPMVCFLGSN